MSLETLLANLVKVEDEEWRKRKEERARKKLAVVACKEHIWKSTGGRPCPYLVKDKTRYHIENGKSVENFGYDWCSMLVYECVNCGEYDYGYEGGPGWKDCEKCSRSGLKVRE